MKKIYSLLTCAQALTLASAACFAAVGVALVSQHLFGILPCPWCVLQRLVFVCLGAVCLVAATCKPGLSRAFLVGCGVMLAISGIASALWQHFQAAASSSCNLTLADKVLSKWLHLSELIPFVFEPRASCADAQVNLLGVPYEFWSLALFTALACSLACLLARALRNTPPPGK